MSEPSLQTDPVLAIVQRLSRPHPSGGRVIERAAILAAGVDAQAVLRWVAEHAGEGEGTSRSGPGGGLHGVRSGTGAGHPQRYVLPAGALP